MREIKFRAWDKEEKEMYYDVEQTYDYRCQGTGCFSDSFGSVLENERFEVMQYTGLKDKNGKEIYEGDIVKLNADNGCCDMVGIIIYDEYDLAFELRDVEEGTQECLWYQEQELEVIGNIWENKDLLKE